MYAQGASPSLRKEREIPACLRRLHDTECVFLFGNGEVTGVVACNLQENAAIGPALVSLSCGVQEPRTKSQDRRHFLRVPHQMADRLQSRLIRGVHCDIAQESEIISGAR